MNNFIERGDLTASMEPRQEWLNHNGLSGILFIESPGKSEFETLASQVGADSESRLSVAHAEFDGKFSTISAKDPNFAFNEYFKFIHEEVFIEIISSIVRFVIWIPSEREFYALFGQDIVLSEIFKNEINFIKSEIISFSQEPFFNDRTRDYIRSAIKSYFTVR